LEHSSTLPNIIQVRQKRQVLVEEVVDTFFLCIFQVRESFEKPGWSTQSKLSRAEQFLLDPDNPEVDFQHQRNTQGWKDEIFSEFARRLIVILESRKTKLSDAEYKEVKTEVLRQGKEHEDIL
jgi:hypothetical protein